MSKTPAKKTELQAKTSLPAGQSPAETAQEKELVRRCIRHDRAAWDEFVSRYSTYIYTVIFQALQTTRRQFSHEDADDIYADVFLSLVEKDFHLLRNFEWRCSFRTWIWSVTRKRVARFYRKKGVKTVPIHGLVKNEGIEYFPDSLADKEEASPQESASLEETRRIIVDSLADLNARDKLCLTMYYFDGMTYKEISDILSIDVNHVGLVIFRAKKRLEKKLEDKV